MVPVAAQARGGVVRVLEGRARFHHVTMAEVALNDGQRLLAFFDAVRVRYVPEAELRRWDPELRSFLNVNWPDDLARARALGT